MSRSLLPVFSSSFMVPGLTFTFLIHFEFTLGYSMRKWSSLISCSISQHNLWKRLSFLMVYSCLLWLIYHKCVHLFLGLYSAPLTDMSVSVPEPLVLMTVALSDGLKSGSLMPPVLFFCLSNVHSYFMVWVKMVYSHLSSFLILLSILLLLTSLFFSLTLIVLNKFIKIYIMDSLIQTSVNLAWQRDQTHF